MSGWIKLHRKTLENPIVCKDSDHIAVWTYLLLNATHKEHQAIFSGEKITLMPGQLITGRKAISEKFNIHESKVQRILKSFEIEQQIEQQTSNRNRLITILSWDEYQCIEQQVEQPVNNKRTTDEQPVNTNKNVRIKECKNERNNPPPKSPKGEKVQYADYVFLKEDEYHKLTELLGEEERDRFFLEYASWISGQTPSVQKRRDAYLTILNWYRREQKKPKPQQRQSRYQQTVSELDRLYQEAVGSEQSRSY